MFKLSRTFRRLPHSRPLLKPTVTATRAFYPLRVRQQCLPACTQRRHMHSTPAWRDSSFTNILADATPPPVQVKSITEHGIQLDDGLLIPAACVFLEGQVFLWDVPAKPWDGWGKEHFAVFETVVPRPEILLLGTGSSLVMMPPSLRSYMRDLGIQVDVMDTRNACATYNLLSEEGRRVAAALLPLTPNQWKKQPVPS